MCTCLVVKPFWARFGVGVGLVGGSGFEHGEDDVAAASGDADDGGVVAFAFGSFGLVVGAGGGVVLGRDEGCGEDGVLRRWLPPRGLRVVAVRPDWRSTGASAAWAARRAPAAKRRGSPISARVRAPVRGPNPHRLGGLFPVGGPGRPPRCRWRVDRGARRCGPGRWRGRRTQGSSPVARRCSKAVSSSTGTPSFSARLSLEAPGEAPATTAVVAPDTLPGVRPPRAAMTAAASSRL